jgi:hypothetical protein
MNIYDSMPDSPFSNSDAMFIHAKTRGPPTYLHIVENKRVPDKVVQHLKHSHRRLDQLQYSGKLDARLASGPIFAHTLTVLDAHFI